MRNYWKWILSLTVPAVLAVTVQAAEGPIAEVGTVELMLLRQHTVQQELKIGKKEATAIREFTNEQHMKAMKAHKLGNAEMEQKYNQLERENEEFLKARLTAQQNQRLKQIAMQGAGLLWVTHPDIASKLNLTEKQIKQAQADQKLAHVETDAAFSASPAERDTKLKVLKETCHKRLMSLLSPEQHAIWKEMIGTPFVGEFVFEEEPAEKKN